MNPWSGVIGHVGVATADGRTITRLVGVNTRPRLPLFVIWNDGFTLRVVGRIETVEQRDGETEVRGSGTTTLAEGEYFVALQVAVDEAETAAGSLEMVARLGGMAIVTDETSPWPDTKITVTKEPQ